MVEKQNVGSGSMLSDKYDVLFRGNLQAGQLNEQMKDRVAELFKLGPEKLEQIAETAAVDHSKLAGLVAEPPGTDVLGAAEKVEVKTVDVSHLSLEDL